jgi:hypothetical protein
MRSAVIVVALFIFFFSSSGWSEIKYFKIPTPPEKSDKGQETTPQKPAETKPAPSEVQKKSPSVSTPSKPADAKTEKRQDTPPKSPPPKADSTKKQKPRGPYVTSLQIASFQTLDQARKEESRLIALGVDAFIRHEKVKGKGMRYRVYAGKFNSKRQALDYEQELKRKGIIRWSWVKRLRVTPAPSTAAALSVTKQPTPPKPAAVEEQAPKKDQAPPPAPVRRPKKTAPKPAAKPAPAPTVQTAPQPAPQPTPKTVEKDTPAPVATKPEKPAAPKKSKPKDVPKDKTAQPGRFSLGLHGGMLYAAGASDFRITQTTGSDTEHWKFEDLKAIAGLNFGWRISDHWSLDAGVEQIVMANLDSQYLTLGPKFHFSDSGAARVYVRAALVYGTLSWDEAPGDFDSSVGAEIGYGVDFIVSNISFGLEAVYRHITFDYSLPSGDDVTTTDSEIDFSGLTVTGCIRYHF